MVFKCCECTIVGSRNLRFSVVRYGNVMGSRGSVIPFFLKQCKSGVLPITDSKMTRFNITLEESIEMVLWAINKVQINIFLVHLIITLKF